MPARPILIVDDDATIRLAVMELLELAGYPVLTAADGAEALRLIHHQRPGLILLDMRMPVLDGWGVARALRAANIRVPIAVMSAAQDVAAWAAEIGADGIVAKPFLLNELLGEVERLYNGLSIAPADTGSEASEGGG